MSDTPLEADDQAADDEIQSMLMAYDDAELREFLEARMQAASDTDAWLGFVSSLRDDVRARVYEVTGEGSSGQPGPYDAEPAGDGDRPRLHGSYLFLTGADGTLYLYEAGNPSDYVAALPPRDDVGPNVTGAIDFDDGVPGPPSGVRSVTENWVGYGASDEHDIGDDVALVPEPPEGHLRDVVDANLINDRNHEAIRAMVSRHASDDERRVPVMMGNQVVLLGDGWDWAAVRALGDDVAHTFVRFHRNRMSANEFIVEGSSGGEIVLGDLQTEIRRHIADPEIYDYGDADRVKFR